MAINQGFLGHGIFLQLEPINGLRRYANYKTPLSNPTTTQLVDKFIQALTDMHMSSVWFELFTRTGVLDQDGKQGTQELVAGLKAANIQAVPWAYCWGTNSQNADPKQNDLQRAIDLCSQYKLDCFVADIEPWNEITVGETTLTDIWDLAALKNLVTGLNNHFGKNNLGISSFANLDANQQPHARDLLPPLTPLVSFCAPQIYWNSRDPIAWAEQSLQSWRNAGVTTDLVATVQSYWSTDDGTPPQGQMETKVTEFVRNYPNSEWSKIIGLNWYDAGWNDNQAEGGMSNSMIKDIAACRLDQKPYKKPGLKPSRDTS
jgi:hypothetical protein